MSKCKKLLRVELMNKLRAKGDYYSQYIIRRLNQAGWKISSVEPNGLITLKTKYSKYMIKVSETSISLIKNCNSRTEYCFEGSSLKEAWNKLQQDLEAWKIVHFKSVRKSEKSTAKFFKIINLTTQDAVLIVSKNRKELNKFKIAKELFDKDLELVKRSQAIEQKIYDNLTKNIRDILQNSMYDVFEIIKKYSLDNLDKQAYVGVWDATKEQIFNQLEEQILKQKMMNFVILTMK